MGIAGSPDIFQAKMSELMVALEFVNTYLDDLLCITRASLDNHLAKLRGNLGCDFVGGIADSKQQF